jgi:hypothetical protein
VEEAIYTRPRLKKRGRDDLLRPEPSRSIPLHSHSRGIGWLLIRRDCAREMEDAEKREFRKKAR